MEVGIDDLFEVCSLSSESVRGYNSITGEHNKWDQLFIVNIVKYASFCVYRRSYLIWPLVIVGARYNEKRQSGVQALKSSFPPPDLDLTLSYTRT